MAYKERQKPRMLCIYEALAKRMKLGPGDQYYLLHMDGGFGGECGLDVHTDALDSRCLVLNDLQLRHNRISIQIDTLVICPDKLLVYEAKNYKGDHQWRPVTLRKPSGATMENPSVQLNRTMARLAVLLAELKIDMPIEGFVAFINPEFNLLSAQKIEEYLLPGQIPRHFQNFRVKGEIGPEQQRLADALIRMHNKDRIYRVLCKNYSAVGKCHGRYYV